jgi:hypothetical protein
MQKRMKKLKIQTNKNEPTFKPIFGKMWDDVPPVIRARYAPRPFSDDCVTAEGTMDVEFGWFIKMFSPLLRMFGALVPHQGKNIPTTVRFHSEPDSSAFCFDRVFSFPEKGQHHFRSKMFHMGEHTVIEYMKLGLGLKLTYKYDGKDTVSLKYAGYVWRICGKLIPIPLKYIFGEGYGEEIAITDDEFKMRAGVKHFLLGTVFKYKGHFKMKSDD